MMNIDASLILLFFLKWKLTFHFNCPKNFKKWKSKEGHNHRTQPSHGIRYVFNHIKWQKFWAASWQNQQNGTCTLWRLRSARASAQSDQNLCCVLNGKLRTQAFFMLTAKIWSDWPDAYDDLSLLVAFYQTKETATEMMSFNSQQ